jgi:hypothetical protein
LRPAVNFIDDGEVRRFTRFVEAHFVLLPPRLRAAVELAWSLEELSTSALLARELSAAEGRPVTEETARQRLSRGVRLLARAVAARGWNAAPAVARPRNESGGAPA